MTGGPQFLPPMPEGADNDQDDLRPLRGRSHAAIASRAITRRTPGRPDQAVDRAVRAARAGNAFMP
jgi:hypothetical protein